MTLIQESQVSHTNLTEAGPVLDLPLLSDSPGAGDFVEHRSSPHTPHPVNSRRAGEIPANLVDPLIRVNGYARRMFCELRQQTSLYRRRIDSYVTFSRELFAGPRDVGAVCPSSPYLARAMAAELENIDDGLVLELGAGTGSITQALLQQGIAPKRLIVVERSPALALLLRERFPSARVIEGDARELNTLLGSDTGRVRAVVSGLPLRSLTRSVVTEITQQIRQILPAGGLLIQFTYDLRSPSVCRDKVLRRARTRVIWKNLPPARVDAFVRQVDTVRPVP